MPSKTIEDFAYQIKDYMRSAEVVEGKNLAYSQENNAVIATIENGKSYKVRWTGSATVTLKKDSASGTEVTSGSTSPLSFTADADYDLYFGSSADVTEIMVYDGNDTDDTYVDYYVPLKNSMFKRSEQRILGAKNIGRNTLGSKTSYGVAFTHNTDDSIYVNGTETKGSDNNNPIDLSLERLNGIGKIIISFDISDFSKTAGTFAVGVYKGDGWLNFTNVANNGIIEIPVDASSNIFQSGSYAMIMPRNNFSGHMNIKYMIRLASDPDDTYEPCAMTNRELTEVVPHTLTPHSDITLTAYDCWTSGNVGYMSVNMTTNASISSETTVLTLDKNLFNRTHSCGVYIRNERLDQIDTFFDFDGKNVNTKQSIASGKTIRFTTMFML